MPIKAVNDFVFILMDKAAETQGGMWLPQEGREKPTQGTIISVGANVKDRDIKLHKNSKCLFFKGTGFNITYDGIEYLVIESERIIALV